jgi:hypothetical protein
MDKNLILKEVITSMDKIIALQKEHLRELKLIEKQLEILPLIMKKEEFFSTEIEEKINLIDSLDREIKQIISIN